MNWNYFGWFVAGVMCGPFIHLLCKTCATIVRNARKNAKELR